MKLQDNINFPDDYNLSNLSKINLDGFFINVTKRYETFYADNRYERFSSYLFLNYVKEDSVVVDVGANYGYYSLLASTLNKKGETISFEPVQENFEILSKNLKDNGFKQAKAFNLAVSDKTGQAEFNITEASDSSGFYLHPNTNTIEKRLVKTTSLDDFFQNKKIDLLKIDTEGHEMFVLAGMENIIKKNKDIKIFIEFNPKCLLIAGTDPDLFINKINNLGFDFFIINEDNCKLFKLDINNFNWTNYLNEKEYCNLLCVKKENLSFVSFISHTAGMAGAERSLLDLIDGLKSRGVLSHVVIPQKGPLEEELKNRLIPYDILYYRWWTINEKEKKEINEDEINTQVVSLASLLEKINPDIIYTNTSVINVGALAAKVLGKPHIWHIREFGELDHNLNFILPIQDRSKFVYESSEQVIFNSKAVEMYYNGDLEKSEVVYNNVTINTSDIIKINKIFKRETSYKLAVVGTIHSGKNQEDVLFAVQNLVRNGIDTELVIIGEGDANYIEKLKDIISDNKLEDNVRFLGYLAKPYSILVDVDVLVVSSKKEAFGRVIIESMLLKKPVIATRVGGVIEIITDGVNGLLYTPGNNIELAEKLKFLFKNKNKAEIYAKNGYDFAVKNYNDEKYSGRISQIFKIAEGSTVSGLNSLCAKIWRSKVDFIKIKDNEILDLIQTIRVKDVEIESKIQTIELKDKNLSNLNQIVVLKDQELQSKDVEIESKIKTIKVIDEELNLVRARLGVTETKLVEVYRSRSWRAIVLLQKIFKKIIPIGSLRRKTVGMILRFFKKNIKIAIKAVKSIRVMIKKSLFIMKNEGFFILLKKIIRKISRRKEIFAGRIYPDTTKIYSNIQPVKSVYYISNVAEGGAKKYIIDLIRCFETPYLNFVQIKNKDDLDMYKTQFKKDDILLFQYLFYSGMSFGDILSIKQEYKLKLVITAHDFYFLGKTSDDFNFSSINVHANYVNNKEFLPEVFNFLNSADLIIYPSLFVKNIFDSIFVFKNSILSKHIDYKINNFLNIPKVEKTINIGIINNITTYKGADYYSKLFSLKKYKSYELKYHIFGTEEVKGPNIIYHGSYVEDDIFTLLKKNNIHGLVFLNKWGETYSYSLTKGINSGLPILYSNIGAYIERLKGDTKFFPISNVNNIESDIGKMFNFIIKNKHNIDKEYTIELEKDVPDIYKDLFSIDYTNILNMKVSVVIPNYNYEKFLKERIFSVINQTYKPFEIIFLDDNSKDGSVKLAESILKKSKIPYRIIKNKINSGCFNQWIKGINESKGDLIWIAEADDSCELNLLENLVPKFSEKNIVISYCQSKRVDENGCKIASDYLDYTEDISKEKWKSDYIERGISEILNAMCIKNTIPNVSATIFRKIKLDLDKLSMLSKFKATGDWFFYIMMLQKGDIAFSSKILNIHRRHNKSIIGSHGVMERYRELVLVQNYIMNQFDISDENRCILFKYRELVYKNDILATQKEDKNINICFSCDNNYVKPLAATLASILKNSSSRDIYNIYILDGGISDENKKMIAGIKNIRDFNIDYVLINKNEFNSCPITEYAPYITVATYYRFKIPSYLKQIDKVLYMDCDMIVNRDVRELFDTNIDGYYVAAVPEVCNQHHKRRLEIQDGHYYFNAGLLLINNKKWREDGIEEKLFEYTLNPRKTIMHVDQDVLNDVLKYKVTYLFLAWNFQHDAIGMEDSYVYHQKERLFALDNPYIIHYTNKYKPWHKECTNKFKDRYFDYLKLTPFSN